MSVPSRVMVIDTQPLFREGLVAALRRAWDGVRVDEADDVSGALEQIRAGGVEIILVDIDAFPDLGDGALRDVVRACEPSRVIATSNRLEDVSQVMASGVRGYVTKTMSSAAFCGAMLVVLGGGAVFPSEVLPGASRAPTATRERVPRGKRELEILTHLERGQSNKAIARALGISLATVKLHVQSILRSTGARNRVEAIVNARRMGLLAAN